LPDEEGYGLAFGFFGLTGKSVFQPGKFVRDHSEFARAETLSGLPDWQKALGHDADQSALSPSEVQFQRRNPYRLGLSRRHSVALGVGSERLDPL
jgi:hypothetical protein